MVAISQDVRGEPARLVAPAVSGGVGKVFAGRLGARSNPAVDFVLSVTNDDATGARDIAVDLALALGVAPATRFRARDVWRRSEFGPGVALVGNVTFKDVPALDTVLLRLSSLG